jgi:inner membrane protein
MTWPTHALFGISSLWLLALLPPEWIGTDFGTLAAIAAFGALLPDLDASESKIKHLKIPTTHIKPFLLPALFVSRSDQHRGLLHSLIGPAMVGVICVPALWWTGWAPVVALLLGYASHLMADAATKSGIRLLHPSPQRFHLLPLDLRFTTGSMAEEVLIAPLTVSVMCLLLSR